MGCTARAELTGSAFTLVAPEEEAAVRDIEKAIGKRLPRVTMPDFDYQARPAPRPEPPRGAPHNKARRPTSQPGRPGRPWGRGR